ncbi:hypothetical protein RHGRI_010274 [Rhododendron griersonianum]|uniref:Uncharacterized protein n=1 Tax=Rhododendron griersonianum TaxID=479676 RepID=A0AAV6KIJ9_9ERIC|nr:hypothetical protein RHGRI_010274 [Rhododendron griersonianum]
MKTTATVELVFIPSPGMGHLVSTVELAKKLVGRDDRLSITVLIMKRPFDKSKVSSSTQSLLLTAAEDRLKFVYLPLDEAAAAELQSKFPDYFMLEFIKMNQQHVRDHVRTMVSTGSTRIAGFVVDMFCTPMMDVAVEFGVPSYAFFTSNATVLGLVFHLESLSPDEYHDLTELKDSDTELELPGFLNPVPVKVLPASFRDREFGRRVMSIAKRLRQTKGIMVNTFEELESNAVRFLAENDKVPPVYPVGPVIHLVNNKNEEGEEATEIVKWLDNQPLSSVVFLCFGSMGSFGGDQLDYKKDIYMSDSSNVMLVTAEEIENGIRKLMESENECGKERKQRVKEMCEKSKVSVVEGGSSYNSIGLLIEDFMKTS